MNNGELTDPELEGDVLRLDLHRALSDLLDLLAQVDVLHDAEDVVGVDHVLGGAARAPRRRLHREVSLLVAPRQRRTVVGGVVLRVEGAVQFLIPGLGLSNQLILGLLLR